MITKSITPQKSLALTHRLVAELVAVSALTVRNRIVMERIELIEKLAALVPRLRYHVVHYYGVLAPAAKWRRDIVPGPPPGQYSHKKHMDNTRRDRKNYTWAQLMALTFELDVLQCPRCSGRMKIIAAIESPEVACRILDSLGIVSRPPPLLPARHRTEELEHC